MPTKKTSKQSSETVWQSLQFRLTVFPSSTYSVKDQQTWWTDLTGEKSENINITPKTGEKVEEGLYGESVLTLTTHPTRVIDWRYSVNAIGLLTNPTLPSLGQLDTASKQFEDLMKKWFQKNPDLSLKRIAFGSDLVQQVESMQQGLGEIGKYVPVKIDPENTSDFLYQINRMRNAPDLFPNLKVNRLSKWSVAAINRPSTEPQPNQERQPIYVCRLELDINTDQNFEGEFKGATISKVFSKLIKLGTEIAEKGDIP